MLVEPPKSKPEMASTSYWRLAQLVPKSRALVYRNHGVPSVECKACYPIILEPKVYLCSEFGRGALGRCIYEN